MIAAALSLLTLMQAPMALSVIKSLPEAVSVRGPAELSAAEAFESARTRVDELLRQRWHKRAERMIIDQRPFWLPRAVVERAVSQWLARQAIRRPVSLVDREDRVREHEFGTSYQTTLWVAENHRDVRRGQRGLQRVLDGLTERSLATAGGTILFWVVLAMALGWIDRLSRGYMTGRLFALGILLGAVVPSAAFLL